ncbi:hypothetical protein JTB14_024495 [Gonioctena quinquepunctata]|nr:hypothetical protein JTB14_024495 [Gonioctena quinquepunctata]
MNRAIQAVNSGEMGWLKASKINGVPQATLRRRAQNKNKQIIGTDKVLGRYLTTFSLEWERELVEYLLHLESMLFGLTCDDVRKLAYQLAVETIFAIDLTWKRAGWDWLRGFRQRNPKIFLRNPEPTSAGRAQGFDKTRISQFFKISDEMVEKHKIDPSRFWKVDETGMSTVQRPQKVILSK